MKPEHTAQAFGKVLGACYVCVPRELEWSVLIQRRIDHTSEQIEVSVRYPVGHYGVEARQYFTALELHTRIGADEYVKRIVTEMVRRVLKGAFPEGETKWTP